MNTTITSNNEPDFTNMLNGALSVLFKDVAKIALSNPSQSVFFLRTLRWQRKAKKMRDKWASQGLHVPPILVISVTNKCNLSIDNKAA